MVRVVPGKVTLKEVAESAGVDTATASRALSADKRSLVRPSTRQRVIEAAQALGYRGNSQASALRRGRTGTVGVIVADLSNPFIGPVLRGVASMLDSRDLLPIMTETRDAPDGLERICDRLLSQGVDGIIATAGRSRDRSVLTKVAAEVPIVLAVRGLPGSGIPEVSHDDVTGGRMAGEHLASLGHEHFAQLMGPGDISSFQGRGHGFRNAVHTAGATCLDVVGSGRLPTVDEGRQLMSTLLATAEHLPTAVFAHNDSLAIGAIAALRDRGLDCPGDISVVGYNDVPLTEHIYPPLTTIRLPGYQLGRLAAEHLLAGIEGTEVTTDRIVLAPELVVRASTRELDPHR